MQKVILAIITTLIMTYVGMWLDGLWGTDNFFFAIIIAIITMGSFILYSIENKTK